MSEPRHYVRNDEAGVIRVGDTRVPLDSIVASFEQGASPETIQQQYPALSLEEVYGAITYCLAYPERVQEYLGRQDAVWNKWRSLATSQESPLLERLRALHRGRAAQAA